MAAARARAGYGQKKDANHNEIVDELQRLGAHVIDTSALGGGFPDLLVWVCELWHLVEIKNPSTAYGRRGLNLLQQDFAKDWQGGPVILLYTKNDCKKLTSNRTTELISYGGDRR